MNANPTEQTLLPNFSNYTGEEDYLYQENYLNDYYNFNIIIFIFLIAGICVGLPALVWAVWIICQHCKSGGRISAFILLLLLNDLSELILSVFILSVLDSIMSTPISEHYYQEWHRGKLHFLSDILLTTFRICGLYLHQLVALECILCLKNQTCSAHICPWPCSIILSILLWLVLIVIQVFDSQLSSNTVLCLVPFFISALTCLLTCKAPPNHDHVPHTGMKEGSAVLVVSTFTLFTVCATIITVFVYELTSGLPTMYNKTFAFLVSVRVVSDPLLCVLVCKERLRAQTKQTHTDQTLV